MRVTCCGATCRSDKLDPNGSVLSAMCLNVRSIARDDAQHFVGLCEHGTVFLTWQRFTWRFDPADFVRLSTFVTCAAQADCALCSGDYALCPTAAGLRLWVAEVGLTLSQADFERLRDLLENALWALQKTSVIESPADHLPALRVQKVVN